jgi:uncharacterized integral membrane protein
MYRFLFALAAVLALGAGVTIGALNAEAVSLDLLFLRLHWPLGLVVVAAFAAGLLAGVLATWLLRVLPLSVRERQLRKASPAPDETVPGQEDA